ncbi:hypothetical protein EDD11_001281 [Mortierella claussenii]|nr:hypothetical protein EDD11_001281 [Mortierella claussenii]
MAKPSLWGQYKALPPRTRMYIGLGGMAFAWGGLYVSDALEEKLDPNRKTKEIAPSAANATAHSDLGLANSQFLEDSESTAYPASKH